MKMRKFAALMLSGMGLLLLAQGSMASTVENKTANLGPLNPTNVKTHTFNHSGDVTFFDILHFSTTAPGDLEAQAINFDFTQVDYTIDLTLWKLVTAADNVILDSGSALDGIFALAAGDYKLKFWGSSGSAGGMYAAALNLKAGPGPEPVPLPPAVLLFGSALLGFAAYTRKKLTS